MLDEKPKEQETIREFKENPYNPGKRAPEDIVRIFYINDVPIIPVISKRGILLGILKKEDVISELSDIERVKNQKIDQFIKRLAKKMSLDEILHLVGVTKEFAVINLFGEIHGRWSRLDLFYACEHNKREKYLEQEMEKQKENQILEWIIYLILEHIPRALYAMNIHGKTIFYNSYFEEIYKTLFNKEIDIKLVEESINNKNKNQLFNKKRGSKDLYFYNKDLDFYYEKTPLINKGKTVGYLIYCDKSLNEESSIIMPGINLDGISLKEMMESIERIIIVEAIRDNKYDLNKVMTSLKISKQFLQNRINKYGIEIPEK